MRMCLELDRRLADQYTSPSQKARVLTEGWVRKQAYCPNCGNRSLEHYSNNKPVADFFCGNCSEDFELKSKKDTFGLKIVDGAYQAMLSRLANIKNPNFFLLNYELKTYQVSNFIVIPKHFFVSDIIEKRAPLSKDARRAGWVGCNILLNRIPEIGRIFLVRDRQVESKNKIQAVWQQTLFLRQEKDCAERGWLLDIMNCVDMLGKKEFTLSQIYAFEESLRIKHPQNKHIKEKIRQQLQRLRDEGYLDFVSRGVYRQRKI
jgi:type II restriction enzyme